MELDPADWAVHRHLVDPRLDELDTPVESFAPITDFGRSPITPIFLPAELWGLDTEALERLTLETRLLTAAGGEVKSAG
jgi:hypothetical protein